MADSFDIVVAGGGIAGLSAAVAAARLGRRTLVLAGDALGGNLLGIEAVEGYPGSAEGVPGYELVPAAHAMAAAAGAEFEMLAVSSIEREGPGWKIATRESQYTTRSLIVATGASPKKLGVPGEERFAGKGVSHCASCDGPMLRGATVAAVGGGDSAMQESLTLAKYAERVVLLCRDAALGGQASYRHRVASHPGIEIRFRAEVQGIEGNEAVSAVQLVSGERLDVAAVFTYIGLQPNTAFLPSDLLDPSGHISTDGAMAARRPGVFAAGLARAGSAGRAIASAGEGALAAAAAHEFLKREC